MPILPALDPAFVASAQAPGMIPGSVRGAVPPEPVAPVQPPIAGVIDPPRTPAMPSRAAAIEASDASESDLESSSLRPSSRASDAQARGKRHAPSGELNISQVWYDEGDELSGDDDAPSARAARARRATKAS